MVTIFCMRQISIQGKVHTFDENFHQVNPNGFIDPNLPSGYGPFGIRNFNGEIFVTYAKQDHKREDDVALSRLWLRKCI